MSAVDELGVELRFASHELMSLATSHIVHGNRATGHGIIGDSITLDALIIRLDEGAMSPALGRLFLDAARTLVRRYADELEATR
jgi:hypothetical protein